MLLDTKNLLPYYDKVNQTLNSALEEFEKYRQSKDFK